MILSLVQGFCLRVEGNWLALWTCLMFWNVLTIEPLNWGKKKEVNGKEN